MRVRFVGSSGLQVSRLGLGTMTWGRDTDEHEAKELLAGFTAAGGSLIDTAAGYGDGSAEEVLGRIWPQVTTRDDLVISTKSGIGQRGGGPVVDTSRRALLRDLTQSLRRLGTDHIDLWLVHAFSAQVPLAETLSALDDALRSGRARYVGVANFRGWQTARAATIQELNGAGVLVAQQGEYSLLNREVEAEVLPATQAMGLGFMPWSPLGRGVLTGKYRRAIPADSRAASTHFRAYVEHYFDDRSRRIVDAVVTAAKGLGCTPTEVALAWVRDQPGVCAPILGARSLAQLTSALGSESVELPEQIIRVLAEVSDDLGPRSSPVPAD